MSDPMRDGDRDRKGVIEKLGQRIRQGKGGKETNIGVCERDRKRETKNINVRGEKDEDAEIGTEKDETRESQMEKRQMNAATERGEDQETARDEINKGRVMGTERIKETREPERY